jgi:hypothetical protein
MRGKQYEIGKGTQLILAYPTGNGGSVRFVGVTTKHAKKLALSQLVYEPLNLFENITLTSQLLKGDYAKTLGTEHFEKVSTMIFGDYFDQASAERLTVFEDASWLLLVDFEKVKVVNGD